MSNLRPFVEDAFVSRFCEKPALVIRAPGRVNLIGEHTDYNDGFVLPLAIERAVWIALRPRRDGRVTLHTLDLEGEKPADFTLDDLVNQRAGWVEYVRGVTWALAEAGYSLQGWEGVMSSDVPIGAGLSSSAALELAVARAFAAVSGFAWDPPRMALLGQKAENHWVGVNCGVMDQMISAAGRADHALLIDCRDLSTTPVPLPEGTAIVVLDTATRRGLVDSAYNKRRAQCEAAAAYFGVSHLRDVTLDTFAAGGGGLDEVIRRRARHVISENERVLAAAAAMRANDPAALGRLMDESHRSMRDDFEISSPALNAIVEAARSQPGCYGARMTGGGFAGCAVAIIQAADAEALAGTVSDIYRRETGREPKIYITRATDGAAVV